MKILVVGASGFVGGHLIRRLANDGMAVRAAVHLNRMPPVDGIEIAEHVSLDASFDWRSVIEGCDVVVHLGARVHVMREASSSPLAEYRRINVDGAVSLARQAAGCGVRRFIFLSSVKACGEFTALDEAFSEITAPRPLDPYGTSKLEAEVALLELGRLSGMQVVVIRLPLIYGAGVRANFLTMMRWLRFGLPLPFGLVNNRRSLIGVDNVVDLISTCLRHPAAAGEVFLASDGQDLSTPELLMKLAEGLGTTARLLPIPVGLLEGLFTLAGQRALVQRLCLSLRVDGRKAGETLSWHPPFTTDEQLRRTARWFLESG
ncbi:NAD-dependent epimerase/dehydratase family protein [Bradyrhizobium sp. RT3a]|uniref:NAD-dependent epimerase/dehydratase family protein n=1 Tax=unclassified Bradyrhizobium TaxID=2631580 RepID=UPI0033942F02